MDNDADIADKPELLISPMKGDNVPRLFIEQYLDLELGDDDDFVQIIRDINKKLRNHYIVFNRGILIYPNGYKASRK